MRRERDVRSILLAVNRNGRPAIGLTPDFAKAESRRTTHGYLLKTAYSDAVLAAGGTPLVLPWVADRKTIDAYLDRIEGVVVTGSPFDIPPESYGQRRQPHCRSINEPRSEFEHLLLSRALERDMPVLGVCNGMQLLNVVLGGTLYQDIPTEVRGAHRHEQKIDRRRPVHPIEIVPGTLLARALRRATLMVNSTHHQAVRRLGRGLIPTAVAKDGIVEAVESVEHRYVIGVQWHPEFLVRSVPPNAGLYRSLINAARKR
jgi:putative glutamine amidotransferase